MNTPTRLADPVKQDLMLTHLQELLGRLASQLSHVEDAQTAIAMGRAARMPREECKEPGCLVSGDCQSAVWQCVN